MKRSVQRLFLLTSVCQMTKVNVQYDSGLSLHKANMLKVPKPVKRWLLGQGIRMEVTYSRHYRLLFDRSRLCKASSSFARFFCQFPLKAFVLRWSSLSQGIKVYYLTTTGVSHSTTWWQQWDEAYMVIKLPASANSKGTASVHVKIDTRSGGNILPLHLFQQLHPKQTSPDGLPIGLDPVQTKLTAYHGSPIPLYGILHSPILWQPNTPGAQ